MKTLRTEELLQHLPAILGEVEAGEEFVVLEDGIAVARLVRPDRSPKRVLGFARGRFVVPDDFDEPLPAEVLNAFEGRS